MRSLSIGVTGMMAQQLNVDVTSNNIANMTTTGYKRRRAEFQDLLYQSQRRMGSPTSENGTMVPAGVQLGLGVKTAAVYRVHEQGNLVGTENPLDVAIQGDGFFQVELPTGETAYTRSGNFQLTADGVIVTPDGFTVQPGITIPADSVDIAIDASGQVAVKIAGQAAMVQVGQLQTANFINPTGLDAIGGNLLLETEASGAPVVGAPGTDNRGSILQSYLESSNVNPVQEITNLITAQRAYDMNSKVISTSDEMMATVTQLR